MVEIASRTIDVIADGKPAFIQVPKLLVTIAPLTPRLVSNMGGLENIQPDEDVGMISSVNTENRLQVIFTDFNFTFLVIDLTVGCHGIDFLKIKIYLLTKEEEKCWCYLN